MEPDESLNSPTDSGSPQCRVQEGAKEEQVSPHLHRSPKDDAGHVNMTCVTAASEIAEESEATINTAEHHKS